MVYVYVIDCESSTLGELPDEFPFFECRVV